MTHGAANGKPALSRGSKSASISGDRAIASAVLVERQGVLSQVAGQAGDAQIRFIVDAAAADWYHVVKRHIRPRVGGRVYCHIR